MNHRHNRRSMRLKGYDYTQPGAYFITICTHERAHLFGYVEDGCMVLNEFGRVVEWCWRRLPQHFHRVRLDEFTVMPNHVHGILWIVGARHSSQSKSHSRDDCENASPLQTGTPVTNIPSTRPAGPPTGSLGAIVGNFKSIASRRINAMRHTPGASVWQRNYYEHIIRNDRTLRAIRRYIADNPRRWQWDRYNPGPIGPDSLALEIWDLLKDDDAHA